MVKDRNLKMAHIVCELAKGTAAKVKPVRKYVHERACVI